MTTIDAVTDLLTDEMLARFDERGFRLRPDELVLHRGLRGAQGVRLPPGRPARRLRRRGPEPRRGQPHATPHRARRAGHGGRGEHAHVLRRARRRPPARATRVATGCSSACPKATSSRRVTAKRATTSRSCCRARRPSASRAVGSSRGTRCSGASRRSGRTSASTGWTPVTPTCPTSCTDSCTANAANYRIEETWDTMGMRATTSHDTILEHTFVPDAATILVCPAGFAGAGPFQVSAFVWALLGFAGVYAAIAQRAFDDTVSRMHERKSVALDAFDGVSPGGATPHREMRIHLEAMHAHLDRVCEDWANGVDHGGEWPREDPRLQVRRREPRLGRRRHRARPVGRCRHLHPQPVGADVP